MNNPIQKWAKDLDRHFAKENIENGQLSKEKKCSTSPIITQMQIKTMRRCYLTPNRVATNKKTEHNKC